MKTLQSLLSTFVLLLFFIPLGLADKPIPTPKNSDLKVWIDETGNLFYQTSQMAEPGKIEAHLPHENLVDVSPGGTWIAFLQAENIFLLDPEQGSIRQLTVNLDPHHSNSYEKIAFSPQGDYLATQMILGGSGVYDGCVYEMASIDFEAIEKDLQEARKPADYYPSFKEKCRYVSDLIEEAIKTHQILPPLADDLFFVDQLQWNPDNTLSFQTHFQGVEEWSLNLSSEKLTQMTGEPLNRTPFKDLSMEDPDLREVLLAKKEGWLQGYSDGTLKLDQPLNRAEFVTLSYRALGMPTPAEDHWAAQVPCPDVSQGAWYEEAFQIARNREALQGYPQTGVPKEQWLCKPEQVINHAEGLKVLQKMSGWDYRTLAHYRLNDIPPSSPHWKSEWYWPYIEALPGSDLLTDKKGEFHPEASFTRRELIVLLNRGLQTYGKWKTGF